MAKLRGLFADNLSEECFALSDKLRSTLKSIDLELVENDEQGGLLKNRDALLQLTCLWPKSNHQPNHCQGA